MRIIKKDYCPFGNTTTLVDFVFMIDLSNSMSENIQAVTGGKFIIHFFLQKISRTSLIINHFLIALTYFAENLLSASINPSYTIVTFAGNGPQQAKLTLPLTVIFSFFFSFFFSLDTIEYKTIWNYKNNK